MPELCRRLTEATGTAHVADATLRDYPVFVSAKSGDAKRVERLVAAALHAEWQVEDGKLRLVSVKPVDEPDRAEFDRLFLKACGKDKFRASLPLKEMYRMPVGQIYRYGPQATETVRKLTTVGDGISVRRLAAGVFEFAGNDQISLEGLPEPVEKALGKDLDKLALDGETRAKIQRQVSDPDVAKLDFGDMDKKDPVATLSDPVLKPVANAVALDMAIALPDFTLFPVMMSGEGSGTVRAVLGSYTQLLDWAVVDGAVVGRLTMTERLYSTQTRRGVLKDLLKNAGVDGVPTVDSLGRYVANQRPGASDGWCDAGLLVLAGLVLDQQYVGHYPFNLRLYTRLTQQDWRVVRTGEPFLASALSPAAQKSLRDLLVQSRDALSSDKQDPGRWPSVRPNELVVTAELQENSVLIGWTSFSAEVYDPRMSAMQYEMRKKKLGREPLYRPAQQRLLKLKVAHVAQPGATIETGFAEVIPTAGQKAVVWDKLPKEMADTFRTTLEEMRNATREQQLGGNPPPPGLR